MPYAQALQPLIFAGAPTKPAALMMARLGQFGAIGRFLQSACASILGFSGVDSITGVASGAPAAIPIPADFASLDALTQAMLEGRLTGPAQIGAAALLFLAAGRNHARLLGFAAGAALIYFHLQGMTVADGVSLAGDFATRFAAALEAFRQANETAVQS